MEPAQDADSPGLTLFSHFVYSLPPLKSYFFRMIQIQKGHFLPLFYCRFPTFTLQLSKTTPSSITSPTHSTPHHQSKVLISYPSLFHIR